MEPSTNFRDIFENASIPAELRVRILSRVMSETVMHVYTSSAAGKNLNLTGELTPEVRECLGNVAKELAHMRHTATVTALAFKILDHFSEADEIKYDDDRHKIMRAFMAEIDAQSLREIGEVDRLPRAAEPYRQDNSDPR